MSVLMVPLALAASSTMAQSPRTQLEQLAQELRSKPADQALRERIVRLGAGIKPPPAIPEEARRRMARGSAAFRAAKTVADYDEAAQEFSMAILAAPWHADAYFNHGLALDKAGQYDAALDSLRLALIAAAGRGGCPAKARFSMDGDLVEFPIRSSRSSRGNNTYDLLVNEIEHCRANFMTPTSYR